jgi:anti-sigma regulatory factor (Ser/Thr protein kinase)
MVDNPAVELIAELGDAPTEVGRARRALSHLLERWGVGGDAADVAVLLTSELVTNAIRHGHGLVTLRAGMAKRGAVRIEVDDDRPGQVVPMEWDLWAVDGRGLQLVDMLADRWGCRSNLEGKRVWFEVRLERSHDQSDERADVQSVERADVTSR